MGVEFNEDQNWNRPSYNNGQSNSTPKIAGWLISKGIAKDIAGANKIQLGVAVVFFALSLYFFFR
jgi:hypothetical protein